MRCEQVESRLQKLLDDRLDVIDQVESDELLREHLDGCPSCAELVSAYHAMGCTPAEDLSGLVPPDMADRVILQLAEERSSVAATSVQPRRVLATVLAIAACLLLAVGIYNQPTDSSGGDVATTIGGASTHLAGNDAQRPENSASLADADSANRSRAVAERWYPAGWGLSSIPPAVLRSRVASSTAVENVDSRALFERAFEAIKQVFPTEFPDAINNSGETGFYAPASPRSMA